MEQKSNTLLDLIKGMVVGLANIIPGVSGGTMMVAMNIYDRLIWSITHLFSHWKKALSFLIPVLGGAVIAIAALSKLFEFLLTDYPILTNLGFCGLIAGSLPSIIRNVKGKKADPASLICFALFFVLIIGSAFLSEISGNDVKIVLDVPGILMLFLAGVISAATMVIPGVSGSMILMLMGYYRPILGLISLGLSSLAALNWPVIGWCVGAALPFGLGVVLGIFGIAKIIEWCLNRYRQQTYWAIIGLITASPIAILINTSWAGFSWLTLAGGIVIFALCFFASRLLDRL